MSLAYSYLLSIVLAIFLFCYFIGTWVWIKVVEKNKQESEQQDPISSDSNKADRRDFLYLSSVTVGGVGVAAFMWPFIKSMNPAEDTLALGTTEVDLSNIMVETDSPYLTPKPNRGKRNEPINVKYVVDQISKWKNLSFKDVSDQTTKTALNVFPKLSN